MGSYFDSMAACLPDSPSANVGAALDGVGQALGEGVGRHLLGSRKIWCWGRRRPVDATWGIPSVSEIKDSFVSAFRWATREGALCGEVMRGARFNLADVPLHADAIHRDAG
ncbi:elongation factor 2, putative [Acanthamoeba castellanii str. Neff]|uniref:Elongation factor 2, putative n=1 Tax=Acanthamoeba castellanii (strain ATCC 30010 / Neff) TaxID=1257118 RepID=L8GEH5_ACACF|nr:elongation factor 2, putative [Acanthamoeba castellanii str. Neff]ELR11088.1 elongation factor 2, putative [Acanthamoeba castellanii str. Neff]